MSGVKIITEEQEKKVTLLKDVNAEYVSLVRHGANRMPFRVVKNEKGGTNGMGLSIQSILIPKGQKLEDLMSVEGLQFLSEAKTDKALDYEGYRKFIQADLDKFDQASLKLLKLKDKAWALVGKMENGNGDGVLTLGKEDVDKIADIPTAPIDSLFGDSAEVAQLAVVASFRDMFEKELSGMLDVVYGALKQSSTDPKKRKNAILTAVDAFKSFLTIGLDAIGKQSAKMDDSRQTKKDEGGFDMFKDKEEFTTAVTEIVTGALTGLKTEIDERFKGIEKKFDADADASGDDDKDKDGKDKDDKDKKDQVDAKDQDQDKDKDADAQKSDDSKPPKWAESLTKKVDDIAKKQEELENQLTSDRGTGDDDGTTKDDDGDDIDPITGEKIQPSVFKGMLSRRVVRVQ